MFEPAHPKSNSRHQLIFALLNHQQSLLRGFKLIQKNGIDFCLIVWRYTLLGRRAV